ncbi:hypothetical protein GCK32_002129 [Trichostrongylus colubriformis]|uniref:Core Histone H2A/H2B/H3 domain-containing protein n=1 Tax=Trichostrongylus colubriformis TaxID=6319 RepID=A0AAN8FDA5_TRICO
MWSHITNFCDKVWNGGRKRQKNETGTGARGMRPLDSPPDAEIMEAAEIEFIREVEDGAASLPDIGTEAVEIQEEDEDNEGTAGPSRRVTRRNRRVTARTTQENLDNTCHHVLSKRALKRVIREIITQLHPDCKYRVSAEAYDALQEASEIFLVELFKRANTCAVHSGRVTVMVKDARVEKQLGKLNA